MRLIKGLAFTRVVVVVVLLPMFGSAAGENTLTVSVIVPELDAVQLILIAAELPGVSVPRLQVTRFPLRELTPMLVWTEMNPAVTGRMLVTFTALAAEGPRLLTAIA